MVKRCKCRLQFCPDLQFCTASIKTVREAELTAEQHELFLLRASNSITTLVSTEDAFRQRERDCQSIFIFVLQRYQEESKDGGVTL